MLIKGNKSQKNQTTASQAAKNAAGGGGYEDDLENPAKASWNLDQFNAGLVADRRQDQPKERRRSYRRIEERDLISKAVEEAGSIRQQAKSEGFEEGLAQSQAIVDELRNTIDTLLNARQDALNSAADEIAALAVEVAERIIKTDVMCDPSLVVLLVRDTIQKAGRDSKTILIKVHPDDLALVKQALLKDEPIPNLRAELIIMEDRAVDQGSCIVETNSGLVDASFSTQLGILKKLFGIQDAVGPAVKDPVKPDKKE